METQKKYGVEYTKYWVNETGKKVFCLAHAPNAEAAEQVHREAHGMMPENFCDVGLYFNDLVRVGTAAAEPVEQNNDLFGSTVQLAARFCAHAQPEQILVSNAIAELCIGKGLLFEDVGEVTLKGFDSPVRAHAAAWRQAN